MYLGEFFPKNLANLVEFTLRKKEKFQIYKIFFLDLKKISLKQKNLV
jgi:hypothetical protein